MGLKNVKNQRRVYLIFNQYMFNLIILFCVFSNSCNTANYEDMQKNTIIKKIMMSNIVYKYQGFSGYKSFRNKDLFVVKFPNNSRFCVKYFDENRPELLKFDNFSIESNVNIDSVQNTALIIKQIHLFLKDLKINEVESYSSNSQSVIMSTSIKSLSYNELKKHNPQYYDYYIELIAKSDVSILDRKTKIVLFYSSRGENCIELEKQKKFNYIEKINDKWFYYRSL